MPGKADKPQTYGAAIARGPMGGDNYTNVHRNVFRDTRLSGKAMGVFGHCSTHDEGWHVTVKSIASAMKDGPDAISGALKELETYSYLIRHRHRSATGQLGDSIYFFTDLPAQLMGLNLDEETVAEYVRRAFDLWMQEKGWSEPTRENPDLAVTSGNAVLDLLGGVQSAEDHDPQGEPVDNLAAARQKRRSEPERDFPGQVNPDLAEPDQAEPDQAGPDRANRRTKKPRPQNRRGQDAKTTGEGDARPRAPQRPENDATSSRRRPQPVIELPAGYLQPVVGEGDHQTAREALRESVGPRSEVVDELALLLAVASSKGISHQQAVTRAFSKLVNATTGTQFRTAVVEHLNRTPGLSLHEARGLVRGDAVLEVLLSAAAAADEAVADRDGSDERLVDELFTSKVTRKYGAPGELSETG